MSLAGQIVVITGGAGFIGSELVRQALDAGGKVIAVDNLVNGKRSNLTGLDRLVLRVEDIRDRARMTDILAEADLVFHLACLGVRHSIHAPRENHDVNSTATLDLLASARAGGVKRFVTVSSSEVYGGAQFTPITEVHPTYPMTVYGASKLAGESYARAYWETYRYPTVVLRPFNTFGLRSHHEGDSGEVIPKFVLRAMAGLPLVIFGDGTQTRDFTFVSDVARAILMAGLCDAAVGQTINIGSGAEITINDLAREISDLVAGGSVHVEYDDPRPGDVKRLCADVAKAHELLGFERRIDLREGICRLQGWYSGLGRSPEELLRDERVRNWEPVAHV
jgi:UDP-glucose 4-epimerase